jgi:hypothetical protein
MTNANGNVFASDADIDNEPNLNVLIANSEAYVRGLCAQYTLSDEDVYEVWQSAREMLADFSALDVNLSSFQSEFERRTFPYVLLKNYQRKYGDTAKYLVNQKLHRSQIPFSGADASTQVNEAWGLMLRFMRDDAACALNRTSMSLTKGASFKDAVECACERFCKCPKDNKLPATVLGWVEKFAKHAGEAWRTEHRYRDQDLDNARAEARKKGLPEPEKPDQTQVWEQGPTYAGRYSYNDKSTSDNGAAYDDAPDPLEYEDTTNILMDLADCGPDENGERSTDYDDHSPTAVQHGGGFQAEKAQRFKRNLQSKDSRGISCNMGPRFLHNRLEKPNRELDESLKAWKNSHVTEKYGVRQATPEEWARWTSNAVDFQEDEKDSSLAGYAGEAYRDHGQFRLGDLPESAEPDQLEVLRKAGADRWYHRELGRVKIINWRKSKPEAWVICEGEEHLVRKADLQNEPWTKKKARKTRKPKKTVAEAAPVAA